VKIVGRCRNCTRDFPIDMLLADPDQAGRCPFCGVPLDTHYGPMLVDALRKLQQAGTFMQGVLDRVTSLGPNLQLDAATIVEPLRGAIHAREAGSAERRATEQAAEAERVAGG
jgi:hypothetical protein